MQMITFVAALAIAGLMAFLVLINVVDTTLLFMIKHSGFVFWIYLGYGVRLWQDREPSKVDRPLRTLDAWLGNRLPGGKCV